MCSRGNIKRNEVGDIENFLYEKTDLLKSENLIPSKDEMKIRNYMKDMTEVNFKTQMTKNNTIDFTDMYFYFEFINIITFVYVCMNCVYHIHSIYTYIMTNTWTVLQLFMICYYPMLYIVYIYEYTFIEFGKRIRNTYENKKYKIEKSNRDIFLEKELELRRKHGIHPRKSQMIYLYRKMLVEGKIRPNIELEGLMVKKKMRSESGVMVVSVIMPPDQFSCSYDCYYCPNDPKYSRSYYRGEPTVMRGERNEFSGFKQFRERASGYLLNGHPIDKVEIIILGGTFSCYQPEVSEKFIRDIYYAANTLFDTLPLRESKSIEEEIKINENNFCKIIGMTVETRPDKITRFELRRFRKYGITRIQMGLQHTDDMILDRLNRECNQEQIKRAIQLSKDEGFKIDIHIMPDLPGSNIKKDKEMFDILFEDKNYRADQWKIYPTNVLEYTKIKEWYDNGTYKPYAESDFDGFVELLLYVMKHIPPYIRVNRVQRDFPGTYIEGGNKITNLRQVLDVEMTKRKIKTNDIRTMEIGDEEFELKNVKLVRYDYESSGGKEIFLSMKSCSCRVCIPYQIYKMKKYINKEIGYYGCGNENKIYGFLRLRLSENSGKEAFPILQKKGLIRELHVYGKVKSTYIPNKSQSQHMGMGSILIKEAEKITKKEKPHYTGMAVISGVGVREYYRKFGYEIPEKENLHGDFMIKCF